MVEGDRTKITGLIFLLDTLSIGTPAANARGTSLSSLATAIAGTGGGRGNGATKAGAVCIYARLLQDKILIKWRSKLCLRSELGRRRARAVAAV